MNLAPIVLFVYNRPKHTHQTIEALLDNPLAPQSHLYIYSDDAKDHGTKEQVQAVRDYLHELRATHDLSAQGKQANTEAQSTAARHQGTHATAPHAPESPTLESHTQTSPTTPRGFASITIIERKRNFGLAESIIDGVTTIIKKHGKIIVLEDDLIVSPHFLQYMNTNLDLYANAKNVACITAFNFPISYPPNMQEESFFIRGADCWTWATWERAWEIFEPDGQKLLDQILRQDLTKEFDLNHSYPYTKMLRDQISGRNNSWAIRWYASAFLQNMLCLYPKHSLAENIGYEGTHFKKAQKNEFFGTRSTHFSPPRAIPTQENPIAKAALSRFYKKQTSLFSRIIKKLQGLFS